MRDHSQPTKTATYAAAAIRLKVLLHEKVHQFLVPKMYILREYRAGNRAGCYVRSSLWRYIEEALAETIAQLGVVGFRKMFVGMRFPVKNGYVFLKRGGGYHPQLAGGSVIPEAAALIYTGVVAGIPVELRFMAGAPSVVSGD